MKDVLFTEGFAAWSLVVLAFALLFSGGVLNCSDSERERIRSHRTAVACIHARGEMRDGVCTFGGQR